MNHGRIKISVCGDKTVIDVVRESLNTINTFEIINSENVKKSDIIYWVYGKGPSLRKYFLFWLKKDPIIINHWIGTDVIGEMEKNQQPCRYRIRNFLQDCIYRWKMHTGGLIHLAAAPWLVEELSKVHIDATYLPITTIDAKKLGMVGTLHEKDIDFFSYVPLRSFDFYGGNNIVNLAQRWQEYTFLIICSDQHQIPPDFIEKMPKNVTVSPRVERSTLLEFFQRSKFFLRYTQHDGLSLSVLEALYFNLQVLWTYDFPHTRKIETQEKLSDSIPSLVKSWHPNYEGHTFVIENFTIEKWREHFLEIIQTKLHKKLT
jgi:hypothetical protein